MFICCVFVFMSRAVHSHRFGSQLGDIYTKNQFRDRILHLENSVNFQKTFQWVNQACSAKTRCFCRRPQDRRKLHLHRAVPSGACRGRCLTTAPAQAAAAPPPTAGPSSHPRQDTQTGPGNLASSAFRFLDIICRTSLFFRMKIS